LLEKVFWEKIPQSVVVRGNNVVRRLSVWGIGMELDVAFGYFQLTITYFFTLASALAHFLSKSKKSK
jgi:hypothetical protein